MACSSRSWSRTATPPPSTSTPRAGVACASPGAPSTTTRWGPGCEEAVRRHLPLPPPASRPRPAPRAAGPLAGYRVSGVAARPRCAELLPPRRVHGAGGAPLQPRDLPRSPDAGQPGHRRSDGHDGGSGDAGGGAARLSAGLLHGALRVAQGQGGAHPRRPPAALVQLPRAGLRLEANPRQGGHLELVREPDAPRLAPRRPAGPAG